MTDWLARRSPAGGVLDYRLPDDPKDIPSHVFRQRTLEYLAQLRAKPAAPATPDLFDSVTQV